MPDQLERPLASNLRRTLDERLRSGALELPLLPEVSAKVVALTADDGGDARALSDLIHRDQTLAGHILRLANSAMFAPVVRIVSLQQAISRLGMVVLRQMVLAITCSHRLFRVRGFEPYVRTLFDHSFVAAGFAQEIARARRWNVEEAFLCGLLHDVGRPTLLQALVSIAEEHGQALQQESVQPVLDELHAQVGSDLVASWSLPTQLAEAVGYHHRPEEAPSHARLAMVTRLSADLAHSLVGPGEVTDNQIRNHRLLAPLNLYRDDLEALLEHAGDILISLELVR
jgi:putative nucleotidyltransferase with HDIG domain